MPPVRDSSTDADLVLELFRTLSHLREAERAIIDALAVLTAPTGVHAPHVLPEFHGQQLKGHTMQDVHGWALGTGARHDQAGDGKR